MKLIILISVLAVTQSFGFDPNGWTFWSPRPETTPDHVFNPKAGRNGTGALVIESGTGEQWIGAWQKTFPVIGGQHYAFSSSYKYRGVANPRRDIVARVLWQDKAGKAVHWDQPAPAGYQKGTLPIAEPEYPTQDDKGPENWSSFTQTMPAPPAATQAVVELYLQWTPASRVEFCAVALEPVEAPKPRKVKIAAVHLKPSEGTLPQDKPPQFAKLIEQAGRQQVDLVVLPETLTYYGTGKKLAECAEPIPGPSTEYFAQLAKRHRLYIVAGLVERDGNTIYNVAALVGPEGNFVGKYRKVCLPRGEITEGLTPGHEYPVFDTPLGKIGMMVCYDGFFPEVARQLTNHGAEIIAWPVWGCNPLLARARACENHVYVVSSTYSDPANDWMISGIFDHYGDVIAKATEWGSLAIAEVDLSQPARWVSLGNFKAQINAHRP